MIKCPKCLKSGGIVSEQPEWVHTGKASEEIIKIQSTCAYCGIKFETRHNLVQPSST